MKLRMVAWIIALALPMLAMKCSSSDCERAQKEADKQCATGEDANLCLAAKVALAAACPAPTPPPPTTCPDGLPPYEGKCPEKPPVVTPPPPVEPPPVVTPPPVTPPPTPPVVDEVERACGLPMPAGASAWVRAKQYGAAGGTDTELNVVDWPELCIFIHKTPANPNQCHLEGLDSLGKSRVACEMAIIHKLSGGKGYCPVGIGMNEWHSEGGPAETPGAFPLLQDDQWCDECHGFSADHWGDTANRDDPQTPDVFEGTPEKCGLQRDAKGKPMAGFWWMSHGDFYAKACLPNYTGCSKNWLRIQH